MKKKGIHIDLAAIIISSCIAITGLSIYNRRKKSVETLKDELSKSKEFYDLLVGWLNAHQKGQNVSTYFFENGFNNIAIYGLKELGILLLEELRNSNINVIYGIDRKVESSDVGIRVFKPEDILEPVDVIVVTAIHYYDEIYDEISRKTDAKIVSLEDVIWYL